MRDEIIYMLGIIMAGFAVNFGLRALPFLLFSGRDRKLPPWIERLGSVASPVIIAALILYSYSGLAWKTLSPYLAGALVVGLQLWRRNPLVSIVAGTALYMTLLACGCTLHRTIDLDVDNPAVRVSRQGVFFGEESVAPAEVAEILADYDVPHERVVYILLDPDVKDLRQARYLMACLSRAGYRRPVLVTKRHAESVNLGRKKSSPSAMAVPKREKKSIIRYKRADE